VYSTCLFCHATLGSNEAIEHFPVGRRLAFDAAKGRLWVVCRKCERWNLSPLEERWEAIEECERLFRETRLRVSTDNIGLARLREGLELVRIGSPQRPEMAAWRYGDQFGRRRRRHLMFTGMGVAAAVGVLSIGPATGLIAGGGWGLYNLVSSIHTAYQQRRVRAHVRVPGYDRLGTVRLKQLERAALVQHEDDWGLRVAFEISNREPVRDPSPFAIHRPIGGWKREETVILTGDHALRAAGKLLPAINAAGAKRGEVESAVRIVEQTADTSRLFARYAAAPPRVGRRLSDVHGHVLANLPNEVRLAFEMAAHEDTERRALEGELALLEAAWRQAEEVAAIADDMFVTDDTRAKLGEMRDVNLGSDKSDP
jgi:hypothetical protein